MDEAMSALAGIRKQTETYLEKMLQQHKNSKPPTGSSLAPPTDGVLSAADVQKQLKAIWRQLVRALILQNGSGTKSVGTCFHRDREVYHRSVELGLFKFKSRAWPLLRKLKKRK